MHKKAKINVGIFGIGTIGSVLATHLSEIPNLELFYFNRSAKSQISIDSALGKTNINISLNPLGVPLDWLLVCIKEYHYEKALKDILLLMNPRTKLVLIRNGMHLEESIKGQVPDKRILSCMINCPSEKVGKLVKYYNHPILSFPKNDLANSFKNLLASSPMQINLVDDFHSSSWMKLMESASLGAIMILNKDSARIFKNPEVKHQYQNLLLECILVAKADNANIPNDYLKQMLDKLNSYPGEKGSSMLSDFINGKELELNAKNGIIVKLAMQYNVPIPLNQKVYQKLKAINKSLNYS